MTSKKTKVIAEFPNYSIDREGNVYSSFEVKKGKPLKPVLDKHIGYLLVTLCDGQGKRRNRFIHRLLAQTFLPNPLNKKCVNHIDGIKTNNSLSNLEWATPKENAQHAARIGLLEPKRLVRATSVVQLTMDGLPIAVYPSLHDADRATQVAWQNIWKVCNGRRKSAGGFKWCYEKGVTTIPKGSRNKCSEAVDPSIEGEEIV